MSAHLEDLLRRFDAGLPLEQAHTIPAGWYTDSEVYQAEQRRIFGRTWQAAGRTEAVREPGSFFTADLAGRPAVVVRDEAGTLRAFANVCRHRAACVVTEAAGKASRFRCRYHGWTYDLAGRLRGAPEFEGVADFRRQDEGLPEYLVDTWGPFVWVHPGPVSLPLSAWLDPLPRRAAGFALESLRFAGRREYVIDCNWKVYVDNYLDGGYHVNTVHPALAGVLDYTHYRTEVFAHASLQTSPIRPADAQADSRGADATPLAGKVRGGETAFYGWVFPNFMVNLYQGVMDTNLVIPLGPDRCRVIFDFYFAPKEGATAEAFQQDSIAVAERIQQEDMDICAEVQRGLNSGAFDTGRYSVRREESVYHFHRLLAARLREPGESPETVRA